MGVDLPEEADMPPDGHPDRRDDQTGGRRTARPGGTAAETRSHEECYNDLRIADAKQQSVAAQRITAEEQSAADTWNGNVTESRWLWAEYQRRWPPGERRPIDTSNDPPGSWRGEGDRFLKVADNSRVEAACDLIAEREQEKITPALRAIESQDPDRHLIGFDDRLKGRDRIKEKVYDTVQEEIASPEEAVSLMCRTRSGTPFSIVRRHYTQGVWADIETSERVRALSCINSRTPGLKRSTRESTASGSNPIPVSGSRCSFIPASVSRRSNSRMMPTSDFALSQVDGFEKMVLKAFQRKVATDVPAPLGAADIPAYPEREAKCQIKSCTTQLWTT